MCNEGLLSAEEAAELKRVALQNHREAAVIGLDGRREMHAAMADAVRNNIPPGWQAPDVPLGTVQVGSASSLLHVYNGGQHTVAARSAGLVAGLDAAHILLWHIKISLLASITKLHAPLPPGATVALFPGSLMYTRNTMSC